MVLPLVPCVLRGRTHQEEHSPVSRAQLVRIQAPVHQNVCYVLQEATRLRAHRVQCVQFRATVQSLEHPSVNHATLQGNPDRPRVQRATQRLLVTEGRMGMVVVMAMVMVTAFEWASILILP